MPAAYMVIWLATMLIKCRMGGERGQGEGQESGGARQEGWTSREVHWGHLQRQQ